MHLRHSSVGTCHLCSRAKGREALSIPTWMCMKTSHPSTRLWATETRNRCAVCEDSKLAPGLPWLHKALPPRNMPTHLQFQEKIIVRRNSGEQEGRQKSGAHVAILGTQTINNNPSVCATASAT